MNLSIRHWIVIGLGVLVGIAGIVLWQGSHVRAFPLNPADHISSWSFTGAYTGNQTLTDKANADIRHLRDLLGKGEYDDYDLHLGMGNDYALLGDGMHAYDEYNRAIAVHPDKGLGYTDIAHLMAQVGAKETAADAYAKAVAVEPRVLEYHLERLNYLTTYFANDTTRLLSAFTDVSNVFGDTASVLVIEAQWLEGLKRYKDALAALERAKLLSPGKDTSAIDAEIARVKAKQ